MKRLNLVQLIVCLEELGSRNFQLRTWFSSTGPEVSSFSEQVSQTFDDTGLSDVMEDNSLEEMVGCETAKALRELSDAIEKVDQSLSPSELIDNQLLQSVRMCALNALQRLKTTTC